MAYRRTTAGSVLTVVNDAAEGNYTELAVQNNS
jgi:hypothetical protein